MFVFGSLSFGMKYFSFFVILFLLKKNKNNRAYIMISHFIADEESWLYHNKKPKIALSLNVVLVNKKITPKTRSALVKQFTCSMI